MDVGVDRPPEPDGISGPSDAMVVKSNISTVAALE
jgi:hypothetical protein